MNAIMLRELIQIDELTQYKLHLSCRNTDYVEPLDDYVANPLNWIGWNEWRGKRDDWTRPYIFSMMQFYPRQQCYLFGGVFHVLERHADRYVLEKIGKWEKLEARLMIGFRRPQGMMGRAFYLERYFDKFEVVEILPAPYTGETFPGFTSIDHPFHVLEPIFRMEKTDWRAALSNVKGVYLISDTSNGKSYVGSAYGDSGIWSRWACYIGTGHGWNDELTALIAQKGIVYARNNFKLSLLEIMATTVPDKDIIDREVHWKHVLMSRAFGYNRN